MQRVKRASELQQGWSACSIIYRCKGSLILLSEKKSLKGTEHSLFFLVLLVCYEESEFFGHCHTKDSVFNRPFLMNLLQEWEKKCLQITSMPWISVVVLPDFIIYSVEGYDLHYATLAGMQPPLFFLGSYIPAANILHRKTSLPSTSIWNAMRQQETENE